MLPLRMACIAASDLSCRNTFLHISERPSRDARAGQAVSRSCSWTPSSNGSSPEKSSESSVSSSWPKLAFVLLVVVATGEGGQDTVMVLVVVGVVDGRSAVVEAVMLMIL